MKNTFKKVFIGFMAFAMATGSFAQQRAHKKDNESYPKEWKQIARMEQDSFFLTETLRQSMDRQPPHPPARKISGGVS